MKPRITKAPKNKVPNDYPRITFRIPADKLERLEAIREASSMTFGQIVNACLTNHLPELVKRHQLKIN